MKPTNTYVPAMERLESRDLLAIDVQLVRDIREGPLGATPEALTVAADVLYFSVSRSHPYEELWKSDGTTDGTKWVYGRVGGMDVHDATALGEKVVFTLQGDNLWSSDGTVRGTKEIAEFQSGRWFIQVPRVQAFATVNDLVFFQQRDEHGIELWATDGTAAGTRRVRDIAPGYEPHLPGTMEPLSSTPKYLVNFRDRLFFAAWSGSFNGKNELWTSDGTEAGTALVHDVSGVSRLMVAGDSLFFVVENSELWVTDGSSAGTRFVKELSSDRDFKNAFVVGDSIFFYADEDFGPSLWSSDGSVEGTLPARRLGGPPSMSLPFAATEENFFFTAGGELWISDGTPDGTVALRTIAPGIPAPLSLYDPARNAWLPKVTTAGDYLFFATVEDGGDSEYWVTDGTAAGTGQLPGNPPKQLSAVELRDRIFFTMETEEHGLELFRIGDEPAPIADLPGDLNRDGMVGFSDFLLFVDHFGSRDKESSFADLDADGIVGFSDFLLLAENFGKGRKG